MSFSGMWQLLVVLADRSWHVHTLINVHCFILLHTEAKNVESMSSGLQHAKTIRLNREEKSNNTLCFVGIKLFYLFSVLLDVVPSQSVYSETTLTRQAMLVASYMHCISDAPIRSVACDHGIDSRSLL